jgi:hypothetical protein
MEKEMRSLGEDRICPILTFPLPKTLKQLKAFWGRSQDTVEFGTWDMKT